MKLFLAPPLQIFCGRSPDDTSKKLQIDYVMEYFSKFPKALQKYLEYLVYDRKLQVCSSFKTFCSQIKKRGKMLTLFFSE